jgi:hypothetical protein
MDEKKEIKVFPVNFEVYAYDAQEAEELRQAIVGFIATHAQQNRPVLAGKAAKAIKTWDKNPFVKSKIIEYFKL